MKLPRLSLVVLPLVVASAATAFGACGGDDVEFASNAFVQVPDDNTLDVKNTFTVAAWVRVNAANLTGRILDKITAGGTDGFLLDVLLGRLRLLVGGSTALNRIVDSGLGPAVLLPVGEFVHVVGSYDAVTASYKTNALPVRLGADSNGNNNFPGLVDEVALYTRVLTPKQIADLASGACR